MQRLHVSATVTAREQRSFVGNSSRIKIQSMRLPSPIPVSEVRRLTRFQVCWTIRTNVTKVLLARDDIDVITLTDDRKMKIYPDIASLIDVDRYMEAALVREQSMLIVWGDSAESCFARAREVQDQMMQPFIDGMNAFLEEQAPPPTKKEPGVGVSEVSSEANEDVIPGSEFDAETMTEPPRRPVLIQSILTGATLFLITAALGTGWKNIVIELMVDHSYIRLAFILVVPLQFWLALVSLIIFTSLHTADSLSTRQQFFMQSVAGCIMQIIGPIDQMKRNSKFYSGQRAEITLSGDLPHVTIQCPVYKEDLALTIKPTIDSIKVAIARYQSRGGSANIFINDDGMNLIRPEAAEARRQFYKDMDIGWVARPKHVDPKNAKGEPKSFWKGGCIGLRKPKPPVPEDTVPFIRAGKFKKASNMNFAMAFSVNVEDKLALIERDEKMDRDGRATRIRAMLRRSLRNSSQHNAVWRKCSHWGLHPDH